MLRGKFQTIQAKLLKRMVQWEEFSNGGKEILIKAVAQALPTYVMGIFKLRIMGVFSTTVVKLAKFLFNTWSDFGIFGLHRCRLILLRELVQLDLNMTSSGPKYNVRLALAACLLLSLYGSLKTKDLVAVIFFFRMSCIVESLLV